MDVDARIPLLGGLSPAQFMRRHWGRKPLLVRRAWPGVQPPLSRAQLFALAASDDVESRFVRRQGKAWEVRHGPLPRRSLPPLSQPRWTVLVQGLDLHLDAARALVEPFRFVPEARFDDLMISWASEGGGVGPHIDAYDVFLLQLQGRRRWRVGRVADPSWIEGLPLRILRRFEPEDEWVLEPGDLLYLPPLWGHDGEAFGGECLGCSVGFRTPEAQGLAAELLQRLADLDDECVAQHYRDRGQPAVANPGEIPAALVDFAQEAVAKRLREPDALARALGEVLSEPKPRVWFEDGAACSLDHGVRLDRRTRMLYDARHVYINGESFRVGGRDARLLRRLVDARALSAADCGLLSVQAREVVGHWLADGWLRAAEEEE